jgi:DNA-binding Lrp family transcriptional regulator
MKPRARQILEGMQEVLRREMELTATNIAIVLNADAGNITRYMTSMVRDGLILRMGLRLQYNGKTRTKHMMWRINYKKIKELENAETTPMAAEGTPSAMHEMPRDQATDRIQFDEIQNALVLVQRVPPNPVP